MIATVTVTYMRGEVVRVCLFVRTAQRQYEWEDAKKREDERERENR